MKITCKLFVGILISALWASCTSEEVASELSGNGPSVFNIYTDNSHADKRTVVDGSGNVQWLTTDRINVNGKVNVETDVAWNKGTETRFGFSTEPPVVNGNYYAVYPAVAADGTNHVYQAGSNGKFTVKMPQEQPARDGGLWAENVNLSVASGGTNRLFFSNVCGIAKISLKMVGGNVTGVKKVRFVSNPGKPVSGTGVVDAVAKKLTLNVGQSESVDVVFATPQTITASTPFPVLWCLPVTSYEAGWKIQIFDEGDLLIFEAVSTFPLTIQRNKITTSSISSFNKINSYRVLYNGNGADVTSLPSPQIKIPGLNITLSNTVPVRANFKFMGWALAGNLDTAVLAPGQANITDLDLGTPTGVIPTVTLYAVWNFLAIGESGVAAPRLYVMGSGASAKLMLTQSPANYGTLFQFGSVIGWNYDNTGNANYNPSISGSSTWVVGWQGDSQHTLENLKVGKGDPCRLAGMTVGEIQAALNSGKTPDNKLWRLPTSAESTAMYAKYSGPTTIEGVVGGTFPNSPLGTFLPAAGRRYENDGKYYNINLLGQYWVSDAPSCLYFMSKSVYPVNAKNRGEGLSIRCVYQ